VHVLGGIVRPHAPNSSIFKLKGVVRNKMDRVGIELKDKKAKLSGNDFSGPKQY